MQEPSVVGRELAKLAMDPDLSREHKVKIGVMKGKVWEGLLKPGLILFMLGWQLIHAGKWQEAKELMVGVQEMARDNMMAHQADHARQILKAAVRRTRGL